MTGEKVMAPLSATAQAADGAAQLTLRIQLEPKDIIELMISLSPEKSVELIDHPKFKDFISTHRSLPTSRYVSEDHEGDDTSTIAGDGIITPITSTSSVCIGDDHPAFRPKEHLQSSPSTEIPNRTPSLASKLNNMRLFEIVAYAYPGGWKDHWDGARKGNHSDLQRLQHIYIHHVDSEHYPPLWEIVKLLDRDQHGQWYSVYELTEVLRAWGFKTPSPAARYQGSL